MPNETKIEEVGEVDAVDLGANEQPQKHTKPNKKRKRKEGMHPNDYVRFTFRPELYEKFKKLYPNMSPSSFIAYKLKEIEHGRK